MYRYKSERLNNRNFLFRRWVIATLLASVPFVIDKLFPGTFFKDASDWVSPVFVASLMAMFDIARPNRVNEILIDPSRSEITFQYYNFNEGQETDTYSFKQIKVKMISGKPVWSSKKNVRIIFYPAKGKPIEISKYNDGFSDGTINELYLVLQDMTSPVGTPASPAA